MNNPAKVLKCSLIIAELIKSRFRNAKEEIRKDSILTGIFLGKLGTSKLMTTFKCSKGFSAWSLEYETGNETKKHSQERYLSPVILMSN